jgi:CHAT domain-containing protein
MSDFYRGLFAGARARPAEALRRAQLKMLADARYAAPYYWAPFILVGDWT